MADTLTASPMEVIREAWRLDPVWAVEKVFLDELWSTQRDILRSWADHDRVAVKSCHDSGKSWLAARAAVWSFLCEPKTIVLVFAFSRNQLRGVLWKEIRALYRDVCMRAPVSLFGAAPLATYRWELEPDWYMQGFSPDTADAIPGFHGKHVIIILDEAGRLKPWVWENIETVTTNATKQGRNCKILAIGNPDDPNNPFKKCFTDPDYKTFTIRAEDTPNFTGEDVSEGLREKLLSKDWVERMVRRHGEKSAFIRAKVFAEFPTSAPDSLIDFAWVEQARERIEGSQGPHLPVIACDVARYGSNETVFCLYDGQRFSIIETYEGFDTTFTAGRLKSLAAEHHVEAIVVDEVGLGAGVADPLVNLGLRVLVFNGGRAAGNPQKFANQRSESYWILREDFKEGKISLVGEDEWLAEQLQLSYDYRFPDLTIRVKDKDLIRKERAAAGLTTSWQSPDRADALAMANWGRYVAAHCRAQENQADVAEELAAGLRSIR